jgi:hypothetical protein
MASFVKKAFGIGIKWTKRFFRKFIVFANMYEQDLDKDYPKFAAQIEGRIEIIDDLEALESIKDSFEPKKYKENVERIGKHKDKMYVFFHGEELAGWGLFTVSRKTYYEPTYRHVIPIPEDTSFLYDGNTMPGFRRKGVYAARISELLELLKNYGKKKFIYMILSFNKPAVNNANKFGFRLTKKFCYLNLGFSRVVFKVKG